MTLYKYFTFIQCIIIRYRCLYTCIIKITYMYWQHNFD